MEIITVTLGDIKRKKYDGDKNLIYVLLNFSNHNCRNYAIGMRQIDEAGTKYQVSFEKEEPSLYFSEYDAKNKEYYLDFSNRRYMVEFDGNIESDEDIKKFARNMLETTILPDHEFIAYYSYFHMNEVNSNTDKVMVKAYYYLTDQIAEFEIRPDNSIMVWTDLNECGFTSNDESKETKNILEKEPLDPYDTKEAIRRLEQYLRVKYPAKFELK